MDYEKKYNGALERAKNYYSTTDSVADTELIELIFPELKEKEMGEKIKRCLINGMKFYYEEDEKAVWGTEKFSMKVKDIIAWLEKQGEQKPVDNLTQQEAMNIAVAKCFNEQKPVDKVEPRFHEGEWVILAASTTLQIVKVDMNKRLYWFNDNSYLPIVDEECLYHWTIQDAKDGDVLVTKEDKRPFIFKGLLDSNHPNSPVAYCGIDSDNLFFKSTRIHWWTEEEVYPATKEQCDILFQKMHEAGYEWNAEKKELKEIHVIDEDKAEMDYCFTKMMNGEKVSPAWSEEDTFKVQRICKYLDEAKKYYADITEVRDCIDWLKSIEPQSHWKPTKEQMYMLEWLTTNVLDDGPVGNKAKEVLYTLIEQLKSL